MSNWLSPKGRPTPKWKGQSITKLRDAQDVISDAIIARRVAERAISEGTERLKVELAEVLTRGGIAIQPKDIAIGYDNCPESPTLRCIYNESTDSHHDACVICGQPAERK